MHAGLELDPAEPIEPVAAGYSESAMLTDRSVVVVEEGRAAGPLESKREGDVAGARKTAAVFAAGGVVLRPRTETERSRSDGGKRELT